jgi:hypothetical protein
MIARAIENQIFMVGCNGVGENGPLTLGGHSLVISPTGEVLYEAGEEETAKIIELDWRLKRQARSGFASFASAPFVTSGAKIVTAEQGLAEAAQRASVGQRVVHAALDWRDSLLRSIELLEKERQAGDYLLVGVNLRAEDDDKNRLRLLRTYAALGCVDAVFDLGELSPADHERLQEICRRADASPSGSPPAEAAPD